MVDICAQVGMKIEWNALEMLIESMGNDLRQLLNYLQMMSSSQKSLLFRQVNQE